MDINELLSKFSILNEDEQFYKKYYYSHSSDNELKTFLENIDYDEIINRRLIITEVDTGYMPSYMTDDTYFESTAKNSIAISKHNRYTPEFNHKHLFFELVYVLSGQCHQNIFHNDLQLTEGQFCIIAPNVEHTVGVFDSDSIVINILIRRNTFEDIFYDILRDVNKISVFFNETLFSKTHNKYLIFDTNRDVEIKQYILTMFLEYLNKDRYYEKILNSQLMILFSKILRKYENNIIYPLKTSKGNKNCIEMITYIEQNYQSVTLQSLSDYFHFSTSYCSRIIKQYTGKNFTEIVQNIKFKKACSLLLKSNISVSKISTFVGFENVEHFTRLFKKKFKMTPCQYRREG